VSLCAILENNILKEYKKFKKMFINDIMDLLLFSHEKWNYEILLEPETKSTFGLIYSLSAKELKVLKKYLNENLKKEYIRPLTFLAGYFILFVFKKNRKLRLYVDYR
jgi:hypothetical protein